MRLFYGIRFTARGLTINPAVRIGKKVGATISKRGIWPSWIIKR